MLAGWAGGACRASLDQALSSQAAAGCSGTPGAVCADPFSTASGNLPIPWPTDTSITQSIRCAPPLQSSSHEWPELQPKAVAGVRFETSVAYLVLWMGIPAALLAAKDSQQVLLPQHHSAAGHYPQPVVALFTYGRLLFSSCNNLLLTISRAAAHLHAIIADAVQVVQASSA